jgi:DNA polymerase-2
MVDVDNQIYGFLLTRQWRDTAAGIIIELWFVTDDGPRWIQITGQEAVLFVAREQASEAASLLVGFHGWRQAEVNLCNYHHQSVNAFYFKTHAALRDFRQMLARENIPCWEADIRPHERFLMERFITAGARFSLPSTPTEINAKSFKNIALKPVDYKPVLRWLSIDIETDMKAQELYSIGVYGVDVRRVFMVGEGPESTDIDITYCEDGRACLLAFL